MNADNLSVRPQSPRRWWQRLVGCAVMALSAALGACGGGVEVGGTGGTGSTIVGPVSGFGSIIVDGVRIDDSAASVRNADGVLVSRDAVKLGTFVEVTAGPISDDGAGNRSATAQSVQVRTELRGPLQAIDLAAMRLAVLGQVVAITADTVIDGGAASLALGQVVEVHGSLDVQAQRFVATRIEAVGGSPDFKVRGVAQNVTAAPPRLAIAGTGYDLERTGIPAGVVDGSFVELRVEPVQRNGLWVATKAKSDDRRLPDGQSTELEGTVSSLTTPTQFEVDGLPVDARAATFEGPAVAVGIKVKVKGLVVSGVLQATSVRTSSGGGGEQEIDLRDAIGSVNTAAQTFVLRGVTVFYGSPQLELKGGAVTDIIQGRSVKVKGVLDSDGQRVVAREIEFESN
jgi:hypothetical protein